MKVFITGSSGRLGLNMAAQIRERYQVSGCYHTHPVVLDGFQSLSLDLTSFDSVRRVLDQVCPDVLVHTAGLTNVDQCESDPGLAYRLNVEAAQNVAKIAAALQLKLVHISTDHLFDGTRPERTEADLPTPLNVYAQTKWRAEQDILELCPDALIVRTNFYGWSTSSSPSFSDWILRSLGQSQDLRMFSDVYFTPILINDLIELVLDLVLRQATGIFHVAGGDRLSKYSFAIQVAQEFGYSAEGIHAVSVQDSPLQARRPRDMSLSSKKAQDYLRVPMPRVTESLRRLRYLRDTGWPQTLDQALHSRVPLS